MTAFHRHIAGRSVYGNLDSDHKLASEAEYGSLRLLRALLVYGLTHGLPNLGTAQIRIRLNDIDRPPPPAPVKPRPPHPKCWLPEEDAKITLLRAKGLSYGQIAMRLRIKGRTGDAVAARLRILAHEPRE